MLASYDVGPSLANHPCVKIPGSYSLISHSKGPIMLNHGMTSMFVSYFISRYYLLNSKT